MSFDGILDQLHSFGSKVELMPPASGCPLDTPKPYGELLCKYFNGGELFIPGTQLYSAEMLPAVNSKKEKDVLGIPGEIYVIGITNYGDPVCMESNAPYRVILWDAEQRCPDDYYDSIDELILEEIECYEAYIGKGIK